MRPPDAPPTFRTAQGIGDIFWTYQKLAPRFSKFRFKILITDRNQVQLRSKHFLAMLPNVTRDSTFELVTHEEYSRITQMKPFLPPEGTIEADYCVNTWLEEGTSLYGIEPGPVLRFVDLVGVDLKPPVRTEALTVFVAGAKAKGLWTGAQWASVVASAIRWLEPSEVNFIGADWDIPHTDDVITELQRLGPTAHRNVPIQSHCGRMDLPDSINEIRRAKFFIGYQSGLNILAENYNCPQLMVYFDHLARMGRSWVKPETENFRWTLFKDLDRQDFILRKIARELSHVAAVPTSTSP